jgi:enoyl-[acyl-carrier-protein] reductase (NADH)
MSRRKNVPLKRKKGLIVGIANRSMAFCCAAVLRGNGAELAVTIAYVDAGYHIVG